MSSSELPQDRRFGKLKHGNPSGDLTKSPRCGAKTRRGTKCQCPAMGNGRCRLHGGLSTGARTRLGLERIRRAVTKHGLRTKDAKEARAACRLLMKLGRDLINVLSCDDTVE